MKKLMYISTVTWNFYPWRHSEVIKWLSNFFDEIFYIEPIKFIWHSEIIRFKELSINKAPDNLYFISRKINFKKWLLVLFYENIMNLINLFKIKPNVIISNDIYSSIFLCIYCKIFNKKFIFDYMDDWSSMNIWLYRLLIKYLFSPIICNLSYKVIFTSMNLKNIYWKKNWFFIPNWKYFNKNDFNYNDRFNSNKIVFISSLRDWYDYDVFNFLANELKNFEIHLYWNWDNIIKNKLINYSKNKENFFYHWNIESSNITKILNESFCWIIPLKLSELNNSVLPIKLIDFLELWIPIITSKTSEMLELKKKLNLSIDYFDNNNDILSWIKFLKENSHEYSNLSIQIYSDWLRLFDYKTLIQAYYDIINK